ncbi:MAG: 23S rRNA (pseudouridine(1915)-N(3))-methyltransferase RlmH [Anaerosomatales bacterium]|nr:23S rRNA (pseudouridine(1915)-N(3))-methyltransferase RlmH [Anaerosomatales bacterium]
MRIAVVAVGKLKERHWRDAAAEYLKRLAPYATIEVTEVADRDVTRDERRALAAEAADILRAVPESARLVLLDIGGKARGSEEIAAWLSDLALDGDSHVAFVLGGAAGVADEVRERAAERLSLGPVTLPHQLARVVLLEQLYRAFKIARNEPYHR